MNKRTQGILFIFSGLILTASRFKHPMTEWTMVDWLKIGLGVGVVIYGIVTAIKNDNEKKTPNSDQD